MDLTLVLILCLLAFSAGFLIMLVIRKKADYKRSLNMTFLRVLIPKKDSDLDERKETIHDFK